jgi:hypothetical protein
MYLSNDKSYIYNKICSKLQTGIFPKNSMEKTAYCTKDLKLEAHLPPEPHCR